MDKETLQIGDTVEVSCPIPTDYKFTSKVKNIVGNIVYFEGNHGFIEYWFCKKIKNC